VSSAWLTVAAGTVAQLLVHSDWTRERGWRVFKRPGVDIFLQHLSQVPRPPPCRVTLRRAPSLPLRVGETGSHCHSQEGAGVARQLHSLTRVVAAVRDCGVL
jgi:hypothetical protein